MDINSALKMEIFVGGAVSSAGTSALLYARETPVVYPLFDYHIYHSPQRKLEGILHSYSFYIRIYTITSRCAYTGSGHLIYRVVVVWGSFGQHHQQSTSFLAGCLFGL